LEPIDPEIEPQNVDDLFYTSGVANGEWDGGTFSTRQWWEAQPEVHEMLSQATSGSC